MIGLELSEDATHLVQKCLEQKLLINCTHNTVIRLLPALNITDAEIDEGCDILEKIILG
jgi:acetylornithine/succinyldiaminopimelate/putrescine aminotransferase